LINSVIVLYDFQYNEAKSKGKTENIEIKFIGIAPQNSLINSMWNRVRIEEVLKWNLRMDQ